MSKGYLVLENGKVFTGKAFGARGKDKGELVYNTSMMGYQEILTSPSAAGEIINFSYPLIGNYGTNQEDSQTEKIHAKGVIVKELAKNPSNWRSEKSLQDLLEENKIVGLEGIDTRSVTKYIREFGPMGAIISNDGTSLEELQEEVKNLPAIPEKDIVKQVSTKGLYGHPGGLVQIVIIDFGVKKKTIKTLQKNNCSVVVFPADVSIEDIYKFNPEGILLPNGPGDPNNVDYALPTIKKLIEKKIPIFGIGLGHQLLAKALGGSTYKLAEGHRGGNHPVKNLINNKVYMTLQNHNYAVDPNTLNQDIEVTHVSLNDNSVEGFKHKKQAIMSVQFSPEGAPGPHDTEFLFEDFLKMIKGGNKDA